MLLKIVNLNIEKQNENEILIEFLMLFEDLMLILIVHIDQLKYIMKN
jgi:hypothetical protein